MSVSGIRLYAETSLLLPVALAVLSLAWAPFRSRDARAGRWVKLAHLLLLAALLAPALTHVVPTPRSEIGPITQDLVGRFRGDGRISLAVAAARGRPAPAAGEPLERQPRGAAPSASSSSPSSRRPCSEWPGCSCALAPAPSLRVAHRLASVGPTAHLRLGRRRGPLLGRDGRRRVHRGARRPAGRSRPPAAGAAARDRARAPRGHVVGLPAGARVRAPALAPRGRTGGAGPSPASRSTPATRPCSAAGWRSRRTPTA